MLSAQLLLFQRKYVLIGLLDGAFSYDPNLFPVSGRRFVAAMAAQDLVDTVEGIRRGEINVVIPGDVGDPSAMGSFHDVPPVFL